MPTTRAWNIHPAIFTSFTSYVDLSSINRWARMPGRTFSVGNATTGDEGTTQAEITAIVSAAKDADNRRNYSHAYNEWEAIFNAGWSLANMKKHSVGCKAGAPTLLWGNYHHPLNNMFLYESNGASWTTTQGQNDTYADLAGDTYCDALMPDFYWLYSNNDNCQKIISFNLAEVRRVAALAGVPNKTIVPFITWNRPNPTWNEPTPLEPETFASILCAFANEDITDIILWAYLPDADTATLFTETLEDFADAVEKRGLTTYNAIDGRYIFSTEGKNTLDTAL